MRRLFFAVLACLGMVAEAAFALPQNNAITSGLVLRIQRRRG